MHCSCAISLPPREPRHLLLGDRIQLLPATLWVHVTSKVTGGSSGIRKGSFRVHSCSNLSKGFLVLHILCSLSSQALNCFPLGTARRLGSPKLWLVSSETVWQQSQQCNYGHPALEQPEGQRVAAVASCVRKSQLSWRMATHEINKTQRWHIIIIKKKGTCPLKVYSSCSYISKQKEWRAV